MKKTNLKSLISDGYFSDQYAKRLLLYENQVGLALTNINALAAQAAKRANRGDTGRVKDYIKKVEDAMAQLSDEVSDIIDELDFPKQ